MTLDYDATGVRPTGGYEPVPKGNYLLKIIRAQETRSKSNHDPQVIVDFEIQDKEYLGRKIMFHRVTFIPREREGAGIAIHFLKTIGEPFEGPLQIDATRWMGKIVRAAVDVELDFNNNFRNVIKSVGPLNPVTPEGEEGVPF